MQRPDAKNILIIKHGAFGDIIQVEGAVHDVRLNYPDARITVMTSPPFHKIFARCPWIDDIFLDTRPPRWRFDKMWALRRRLRAQPFDFVVDFQNNERTAFYFNHLFPPVAWSGKVKGASHRRHTKDPKQIQGLPRFATQLRDAGLEVRHAAAPDVSWMAEDVSAILAEAGVRPGYIVLIPGCSAKHPQKRWPYYTELAGKLQAAGHQTVTVPGPDELDLCRALPSTTLTGENYLDWFKLAGVLKDAAFVIGNDTGPSHLAAHLGARGFGLFGSHLDAERTGIITDRFGALQVEKLEDLSAEEVFTQVMRKLEQAG